MRTDNFGRETYGELLQIKKQLYAPDRGSDDGHIPETDYLKMETEATRRALRSRAVPLVILGTLALLASPAGTTRLTEGFAVVLGLAFISAGIGLGVRYWKYLQKLEVKRAKLDAQGEGGS